jgi:hypothetical protein
LEYERFLPRTGAFAVFEPAILLLSDQRRIILLDALISYSLTTDDKAVRGRLRDALRSSGFRRVQQATWELTAADAGSVLDTLRTALAIIEDGTVNRIDITLSRSARTR